MADVEKKRPLEAAEEDADALKAEIDHQRAQLHTISREDDARVRRKIDMVVLPMVSESSIGVCTMLILRTDVLGVLYPIPRQAVSGLRLYLRPDHRSQSHGHPV